MRYKDHSIKKIKKSANECKKNIFITRKVIKMYIYIKKRGGGGKGGVINFLRFIHIIILILVYFCNFDGELFKNLTKIHLKCFASITFMFRRYRYKNDSVNAPERFALRIGKKYYLEQR